jgi:hypothetical protein
VRRRLGEERPQSLLGVVELALLAHRAGIVEHDHHVRRLAVLAPRLLDAGEHARLGQAQDALRLRRVDPVGGGDEPGRGGGLVGRPEAEPARHVRRDLAPEVVGEHAGGALLLTRHPVALQRDQRVVGDERALLRVDRHELGAVTRLAVVLDQRDLLHRDRRRVAGAVAAHLVGQGQRGVAVVDDRALEPLDLPARTSDVLDGQPLALVSRGVVGGRDRG